MKNYQICPVYLKKEAPEKEGAKFGKQGKLMTRTVRGKRLAVQGKKHSKPDNPIL